MDLDDLSGMTLGQFELRELLGKGGMSAVYRAFQKNLKREVAVKVLPPSLAKQPGYVERFTREAETVAALEHAHIIPIVDYGTAEGISYVAMRLLMGGSLSERLKQHEAGGTFMPFDEVTRIVASIGSALDHAHVRGIVHRDVKPGNIMFDTNNTPYLVDFGIAKLLNNEASLTGTGMALGTPSYMPPEQWRNQDLTPAADQYALAVMAYLMLTGRLPYESPTWFGLMSKHLSEYPAAPHTIRGNLPPQLAPIIERGLAKNAHERYAAVANFADALEKVIADLPRDTGERTEVLAQSVPVERTEALQPFPSQPTPPISTQMEDEKTVTPPSIPVGTVLPPHHHGSDTAGAPASVTQPHASTSPESAAVKPASSRGGLLVGGVAAAVILLIVGGLVVFSQQGNSGSAVTATSSGVAAGEVTPAPEETDDVALAVASTTEVTAPDPTATAPPTATTAPTSTPEPTATAEVIAAPATATETSTPEPTDCQRADVDGDGAVGEADVQLIEGVYNSEVGDEAYVAAYDLNADDVIDFSDMEIVLDQTGCGETSSIPDACATADFDSNGTVEDADAALLEERYGSTPEDATFDSAYDLNGDGEIGYDDLEQLLTCMGT